MHVNIGSKLSANLMFSKINCYIILIWTKLEFFGQFTDELPIFSAIHGQNYFFYVIHRRSYRFIRISRSEFQFSAQFTNRFPVFSLRNSRTEFMILTQFTGGFPVFYAIRRWNPHLLCDSRTDFLFFM